MPKFFKKLTLSFLSFLILFFSVAPSLLVRAQETNTGGSTWYNQTFQDWYGKVYDPTNSNEIFGERYTAAQVQWIVYGIWGFLINTVTGPQNAGLVQCFLNNATDISACTDQLTKLIGSTGNSSQVLSTNTPQEQNLWSLVFATDRPLSGISYVKEKLQSFSLVPVAHAQTLGFGFSALQPVQNLWRAFRNVSFGLFVIVAIVFAFMIMFRVKLSPQTVISVQSALPKIVVSLILVTFSYAIAGFLIDFMYIVIGLISVIGSNLAMLGFSSSLGGAAVGLSPTAWFNFLTLGQPLGFNIQIGVLGLLAVYLAAFCLCLILLVLMNVGVVVGLIATAVTLALLASPIANLLLILAIILIVIVIVVALWISIKTLWGLLKAFVNILLLTILAPIQITLGALIPSFSFGVWIRNYLSNLSVFVVTGAMILFAFMFLAQGVQIGFSGILSGNLGNIIVKILFGPNFLPGQIFSGSSNSFPPLLGLSGGAGVGLLFVITSFVIFTMIPKANELIQSILSGKPFAYGSAIGEAMGPVSAYAGYGANRISRYGDLPYPFNKVPGANKWLNESKGSTVDLVKQLSDLITQNRSGHK